MGEGAQTLFNPVSAKIRGVHAGVNPLNLPLVAKVLMVTEAVNCHRMLSKRCSFIICYREFNGLVIFE